MTIHRRIRSIGGLGAGNPKSSDQSPVAEIVELGGDDHDVDIARLLRLAARKRAEKDGPARVYSFAGKHAKVTSDCLYNWEINHRWTFSAWASCSPASRFSTGAETMSG